MFTIKALSIDKRIGKLACIADCISDNLAPYEHIVATATGANCGVDCGSAQHGAIGFYRVWRPRSGHVSL